MKRIAVVAYGMGNVDSVVRGLEECGASATLTCDREDFARAHGIVLPGVGSFGAGMEALRRDGLDEALGEQVRMGLPFLGVCLGMQLLAARGTENGETLGLGWIGGSVVRLDPGASRVRVPHVGWNAVDQCRPHELFGDIPSGRDFYFVHSFHFACDDPDDVLGTTPYCGGIASVVGRENVMGVQFHPEKSQRAGLTMLRNFVERVC